MSQKVQEEILRIKNLLSEVTLSSSDTLFGGKKVEIPGNGSHAGQKGWASGNAWDIPTEIGTPVYAIAAGTLITFNDYGPVVKKVDGKRLFGIGFTVDSDGGLPDVYYTHLKDTKVKKGDHVECGQLLGYVMDFPDSSYDHVHIGVEWGHDIREFLNSDGKIKCNGKQIAIGSPVELSSTEKGSSSEIENDENKLLDKILNSEYNGKKIKDLLNDAEDNALIKFIKVLSQLF